MSVFKDILNLLTAPPGSMVYYLVLLFSIWAIVGLALSRWSRGERRGTVPRLLVAGAALSFGRLAFFVLALLDRTSSIQSTNYLILLGPPFERLLDTLSVVLICWAVVVPPQQRTLSRVFIGTALFLAVAFYLIAAMQWFAAFQTHPSALYNLSWQRWAWEVGQIALLTGATVYLLVVPVKERGTILVLLAVLVIGHLLQAAVPLEDEIPHFAAWVRLAHLLSFPLFAAVSFRLIVGRYDAQAANLQAINQESLAQITGLMDLLDTNQKITASLDLDAVLDSSIRSVSQALQSNLCALALFDDENGGVGELSIRYSASQAVRGGEKFSVDDYPAMQHALSRNRPIVFGPDANGQARDIYRLLESEDSGPLIVQPLGYQATVSGMILVCRPGQDTPFTPVQIRKCETMASHIALAVLNAFKCQRIQSRFDWQTDDLGALEQQFSRTKADLENRLSRAKDEIAVYVQKLYDTELAQQRAQNDARELRQELNRTKQSEPESASTIRKRLTDSVGQITLLKKKVATFDTARSQLEQQVQDLEKEKRLLRSQLSKAESTYTDLRTRALQIQEKLNRGSQPLADGLDTVALNSIPYGIVICDAQGQVVHANPAAVQQIGYHGTAWQGQEVLSLWPDDEWKSAVHAVTDRFSTQATTQDSLVVERAPEKLQVVLTPLHTPDQHIGAVLAFQDLHATDEQTRARDKFLSSLAHELRTPMTSILGYTELLMSESVGELAGMQRKFLQRVQANIERMGAMLNDLIGVTAIDSDKLQIELEPVNITQVIASALRKIQFRLEEGELNTHLEIGDIPPIHVDPEHLQQMVDNLLTNACTCSTAGSTINVIALREGDETGKAHLHVAVSDTGGGIAPENRARVFERFYKADNALIAGLGETGVGLSIVRSLVEAHQGHVWIESRMGEGTTFHFSIPFGLEEGTLSGQSNSVIPHRSAVGDNGHG